MNINPIRIEIADPWRFGLVAFLVDRDDFLRDIDEARYELGIKKLFLREQIEKKFEARIQQETLKKYKKSTPEQVEFMKKFGITIMAKSKFNDTTLKIQNKYQKSNNFQDVIKFAIICGQVNEKDLEDEEPLIWSANPSVVGAQKATFRSPQIAIVVNPETNPNTVKAKLVDYIRYYKANNEKLGKEWLIPDTVTNIKRNRIWYWQKKTDGMSYEEIKQKTEKANRPATWQAVKIAIDRYEKQLA